MPPPGHSQVMLSKGQGCDKDVASAVEWFEKAANLGMAEAQIAVGDAYRTGQGVASADVAVARRWYEQAAQKGNQAAAQRLQMMGA